ncbi:hypothetical protein B0J12DRAFT_376107 [Macrophomina phaseolina]|uniref:Uncharacterized protein n=1 Tax=Macrophomina phaseolina TaxID=35725 RepID=A0ABQ8GKC1_9PEZI|nr:hypothetical protein B0J12DRAFT_376107 [Macrophomina phaseolina]
MEKPACPSMTSRPSRARTDETRWLQSAVRTARARPSHERQAEPARESLPHPQRAACCRQPAHSQPSLQSRLPSSIQAPAPPISANAIRRVPSLKAPLRHASSSTPPYLYLRPRRKAPRPSNSPGSPVEVRLPRNRYNTYPVALLRHPGNAPSHGYRGFKATRADRARPTGEQTDLDPAVHDLATGAAGQERPKRERWQVFSLDGRRAGLGGSGNVRLRKGIGRRG